MILLIMENPIIREDLENIINHDLPWVKFKGKTVMVSGANGFLASYIVKTLLYLNLKRDYKITVIAIVRNKRKAQEIFKDYLSDKYFKLVIQDLNKPFENVNNKAEYIIHAASNASPKYFAVDPVGTLLPNTLGTYHLLELARRNAIERFLFISSSEVYGKGQNNSAPLKETNFGGLDPTELRSCYAESKRMGENMCISWMKQYGVPINIVRLFHTYGPGMNLADGRIQADLVSDVVNGRDLILKSSGRATRSFCYITDACLGIFTVLLNGKSGESYNLGNERAELSVSALAKILCDLFPEKKLKVKYEKREKGDKYLKSKYQKIKPNTDKIRALGWKPEYSLKKGFKRMVDSYMPG